MGVFELLRGIGWGAGVMYLLDPDLGRRRRALLFDKAVSGVHQLGDGLEVALTDAGNRLAGLWSEARRLLAPQASVSDAQLEARIRSRLGRAVSHPRAIEVEAHNGRVILRGPVLRREIDNLLSALATVHGVAALDNQLEPHDQPGEVPSLQDGSRPPSPTTNWTPAGRLGAMALGTWLMVRCATNSTPLNVTLGTAGFFLFARAAASGKMVSGARKLESASAELSKVAVSEAR